MSVFPDGNPGIAPPDNCSHVGRFRYTYGDFIYDEYAPVVPGMGNYRELSDAEIEGFLAQSTNESIPRAIGLYVLSLATRAALEAKTVKDYDLQLDNTKRSGELRAAAQLWFDRADAEDIEAGLGDIFEIYGPGCDDFIPEGTLPQLGRRYIWDEAGC